MFSDRYPELDVDISAILTQVQLPDSEQVEALLEKSTVESLNLSEIAELLEVGKSLESGEQYTILAEFSQSHFRLEDTNEVRMISPLYLSSFCIDTCGYCQFSAARKDTNRTRLSLSQFEDELDEIFSEGNRVIELTLATDREFTPSKLGQYIVRTVNLLKESQGSGVLLCSDYLTTDSYRELADKGLWGMVQWDETLDKKQYEKWHRGSPRKSNFTDRLDNHDRAMQAGLEVATGVLLGLADYRYDVLMQVAKSRHLAETYGRNPFVFGTPRIKSIGDVQLHPGTEVSDRQYELALMVYKIAEPSVSRWLQTRESPELNMRNLLHKDVYTYRCGEVKPGGYSVNASRIDSCKGGQFNVIEMGRHDFEKSLEGMGFIANYDWLP